MTISPAQKNGGNTTAKEEKSIMKIQKAQNHGLHTILMVKKLITANGMEQNHGLNTMPEINWFILEIQKGMKTGMTMIPMAI